MSQAEITRLKLYFRYIVLFAFLILCASLIFIVKFEYNKVTEIATKEAIASYEKDITYRKWAAMHGGVYVPIDENTPPNQYLKVENRDVTTTNGLQLTLMNPAYMTRQVYTSKVNTQLVKGHITSLNPINPLNKADDWETEALKSFTQGDTSKISIIQVNGSDFLRLMKPLITENHCLKCHAHQGYKLGDIRGGITTTVPLKSYYDIANSFIRYYLLVHFIVFIFIVMIIYLGFKKLHNEMLERNMVMELISKSELELKQKNDEYLAINEELRQSNDKINSINLLLEKAIEKSDESDKLKTAFLSNMSHEIRTPMNGIIGFIELLKKPNLSDEKRNFYTEIINGSCKQLLSIINDIIDIAKIESNQISIQNSSINLKTLMLNHLEFFNLQALNKKLKLIYSNYNDSEKTNIISDEQKLNQILTNLIGNAIKFTENGSVEYGFNLKDDFIEFYVKDTGIGIEEKYYEVIFDRFRQIEDNYSRKFGGNGLGLSITKAFVEKLGGKIWIESIPSKGSTFYFTIPILNGVIDNNINLYKTQITDYDFSNNKILIAEDEDSNYIFIEEILTKTNAILIRATNGLELIDILKQENNINLILMDIKMPDLNGVETTKIVKRTNPGIPIIAITAFALSGDKESFIEAGCDDYISKPIKEQVLFSKMSFYLKS